MHKISVLFIEDTEDITLLVRDGLALHGMSVTIAMSGAEGLHCLTSHDQYDLILLDLMLPDIDGFELLPRLKKKTNAPIIILSAKNSLKDKVDGIEMGADDYIHKPFHLEELAVRIKARLRSVTM